MKLALNRKLLFESWNPPTNLKLLKWLAIVLPILFLVAVDLLRHLVLTKPGHPLPDFIATYAVMAIAVAIFSYSMFGLVGRLQRKITKQSQQTAVLSKIAAAAAEQLRLEDLLTDGLDQILEALDVDAGLICLVDTEKEEHTAVCYKGFSPEVAREIQKAKLRDDPVAYEVVKTGRPVVIEKVFDDPRVAKAAEREGIKSAISSPLKYEGEVNGILAIATRKERRFSDADQDFLNSIGGQLGMAIRNAVLYEESQLQNKELSALLAVGKAVTSSLDLDEILTRSLETIIGVASADAAEVWLAGQDGELVLRCQLGTHKGAFLERTTLHIGEGVPGIAAQMQEPLVIHNLASDARFLRQGVVKAGFKTFVALPLRYQSKLVGVLTVAALSGDALRSQRELRLLEGIGEWLALAIENSRLYQQVQDVAVLQERDRIAREMHDGIAQLLGYINTKTIAVKKLLSDQQLENAREELTKMEDVARDLYADVREAILGLRTQSHHQDGLLPTLREYVERYMEMSGVQVSVKIPAEVERLHLETSMEIQLIRIVQEALTNVRKHSKATSAEVKFERDGEQLRVAIADNGQGFALTDLSSRGWPRFGLQTMRERAESIGGVLNIDTAPGEGTTVEVRVPMTNSVS